MSANDPKRTSRPTDYFRKGASMSAAPQTLTSRPRDRLLGYRLRPLTWINVLPGPEKG